MTVLAIDPRREADVALIRAVARSCQSLILVVVPGPHSQGVTGALEAGADVCVRESDSVEVLGAQIGSLTGGAQHAPLDGRYCFPLRLPDDVPSAVGT